MVAATRADPRVRDRDGTGERRPGCLLRQDLRRRPRYPVITIRRGGLVCAAFGPGQRNRQEALRDQSASGVLPDPNVTRRSPGFGSWVIHCLDRSAASRAGVRPVTTSKADPQGALPRRRLRCTARGATLLPDPAPSAKGTRVVPELASSAASAGSGRPAATQPSPPRTPAEDRQATIAGDAPTGAGRAKHRGTSAAGMGRPNR